MSYTRNDIEGIISKHVDNIKGAWIVSSKSVDNRLTGGDYCLDVIISDMPTRRYIYISINTDKGEYSSSFNVYTGNIFNSDSVVKLATSETVSTEDVIAEFVSCAMHDLHGCSNNVVDHIRDITKRSWDIQKLAKKPFYDSCLKGLLEEVRCGKLEFASGASEKEKAIYDKVAEDITANILSANA